MAIQVFDPRLFPEGRIERATFGEEQLESLHGRFHEILSQSGSTLDSMQEEYLRYKTWASRQPGKSADALAANVLRNDDLREMFPHLALLLEIWQVLTINDHSETLSSGLTNSKWHLIPWLLINLSQVWFIEIWTAWLPCCRQHFHIHFLMRKFMHSD